MIVAIIITMVARNAVEDSTHYIRAGSLELLTHGACGVAMGLAWLDDQQHRIHFGSQELGI